jgi:hypothetical protein
VDFVLFQQIPHRRHTFGAFYVWISVVLNAFIDNGVKVVETMLIQRAKSFNETAASSNEPTLVFLHPLLEPVNLGLAAFRQPRKRLRHIVIVTCIHHP